MTGKKQDLGGGMKNPRRHLGTKEAFQNEHCQFGMKKNSCRNDSSQFHALLQSYSNQDKMRMGK